MKALRVLIALGQFADPEGRAFPSLAKLAEVTGMDRRNISAPIRELERRGYLRRERRIDKSGDATSTMYYLAYGGGGASEEMRGGIPMDGTGDIRADNTLASSARSPGVIPADALTTHITNNPQQKPRGTKESSGSPQLLLLANHGDVSTRSLEQHFNAFWQQYPDSPRKVNRKGCLAKYQKILASGEATPEDLLAGVMAYAASFRTPKDEEFICQPLTWLNQRRWEANYTRQARATPDSYSLPEAFARAREFRARHL